MKTEKKIICFDLNGTLISSDFWGMFRDEKNEIDAALKGKYNSFPEFWNEVVSVFKRTGKANKDYIYSYWEKNSTLNEGGEELISHLKAKGYKIYIVSCSVDECLEVIARKYKLDGFYAGNHYIYNNDGGVEKIESDCDSRSFKEEKVVEIAKVNSVDPKDIVFVGDGDNDIGAFKLTQHGIAIDTDNAELLKNSWERVNKLSEIKNIL